MIVRAVVLELRKTMRTDAMKVESGFANSLIFMQVFIVRTKCGDCASKVKCC